MKRVTLASGLVALSTFLWFSTSASAFTRLDPALVWRAMPVGFAVDSNGVGADDGGPGVAVVQAARDTVIGLWNGTGSGWTGEALANVTSHAIDNQRNEISWLRTWDPALGDVSVVLAVARLRLAGVGPEFTTTEVDPTFNGDEYDWTSGMPVRRVGPAIGPTTTTAVLLHEVGHGLGLGHSASDAAIMYFRGNGTDGLSADDVAGALDLYPPGGPLCTADAQCPVEPGSGAQCTAGGICEPVPAGQLGAECNGSNLPCDNGLTCFNFTYGTICSQQCESEADCGAGTFCNLFSSGTQLCTPPGPSPVGGDCTFREDCLSGHCSGGTCRAGCGGDDCDCVIGERCTSTVAGTQTLNFCVPGNSSCVRCGDGVVGGDEACDDGEGNSDALADACRTSCEFAACGDGLVDTGEVCDDGNLDSGDGCDGSCNTELPPDGGPGPGGADGGPDPDAGPGGADAGIEDGGSDGGQASPEESGGGCTMSTSSDPLALLVFLLMLIVMRRGNRGDNVSAARDDHQ